VIVLCVNGVRKLINYNGMLAYKLYRSSAVFVVQLMVMRGVSW
jgi:hypothetical protein